MVEIADHSRIKRNIEKMISMGAPEADIDAYVAQEGVTPEALRGGLSASAGMTEPVAEPSTAMDVAKGGASGLAQGAIGLAGLIPDVAGLARRGANKVFDQFMPPPAEGPSPGSLGNYVGSAGIRRGVESVTGKLYEPKTTAGKYAKTVGEFLPGAALMPGSAAAKLGISVAAGLGSEAGGQAAAGSAIEPYARLAGALAGGAAPSIARRAVTPFPISGKQAEFVDLLKKEGVPLTAGQTTGSKPLRWLESNSADLPFSGGKAAEIMGSQSEAFTKAALRRAGISASEAGPEVMSAARKAIGQRFDDIAAKANIKIDTGFAKKIGPIVSDYVENSIPGARPALPDNIIKSITDAAKNSGGKITGKQFQEMRSKLGKALKTADGPYLEFLSGVRRELDDLVARTAKPGVAKDWANVRREYANLSTIEKAMGGAGAATAEGVLSPQALRTAVKTSRSGGYTRGTSDLAGLARAGSSVMPQMPNSGTAPRNFYNMLTGLIGGGAATGIAMQSPKVLAAAMAPSVAGRTLMSKPVQAYLKNQRFVPKDKELTERLIMALRPDLMRVDAKGK